MPPRGRNREEMRDERAARAIAYDADEFIRAACELGSVGWAKVRSAVPTIAGLSIKQGSVDQKDGGHASLCPPYTLLHLATPCLWSGRLTGYALRANSP
jgi:hypothetical protein